MSEVEACADALERAGAEVESLTNAPDAIYDAAVDRWLDAQAALFDAQRREAGRRSSAARPVVR